MMNQFVPVEMGLYRLTGDDIVPTPEQMARLKIDFVEATIRKRIKTIIFETCERYIEVDLECIDHLLEQSTNEMLEIVKKGYGV
jgi:hypothetical protein